MTYEPINNVTIMNYGCVRSGSFSLTPLHALIGPNDSGKSTVLRAIRTAAQFGMGTFSRSDNDHQWHPFDPMLELKRPFRISLLYRDVVAYDLHGTDTDAVLMETTRTPDNAQDTLRRLSWNHGGLLSAHPLEPTNLLLARRLTRATMVRFDPDSLRTPSQLIPDASGINFADERGTGLASVFDAIINRDADAFTRIQADVRSRFPSVAKVGLINVSSDHKEIAVTLDDGNRVGANAMSEGLLYYLGFAALRYIAGSRLFLVEEPENGLHPSRIAEVVSILREISKSSQVIIATHSPLVINELQPHEVSVLTRDAEGTHAVLMKDTPDFEERSKVYALGELWLSYANGYDESPLLKGGSRA
jgi:predicted ATPase